MLIILDIPKINSQRHVHCINKLGWILLYRQYESSLLSRLVLYGIKLQVFAKIVISTSELYISVCLS